MSVQFHCQPKTQMITISQITKLELSFDGSPFCKIAMGDTFPNRLELSLDGSPWWGHSGGSIETITTGNIKRILKVDWPYVKTIINVEG